MLQDWIWWCYFGSLCSVDRRWFGAAKGDHRPSCCRPRCNIGGQTTAICSSIGRTSSRVSTPWRIHGTSQHSSSGIVMAGGLKKHPWLGTLLNSLLHGEVHRDILLNMFHVISSAVTGQVRHSASPDPMSQGLPVPPPFPTPPPGFNRHYQTSAQQLPEETELQRRKRQVRLPLRHILMGTASIRPSKGCRRGLLLLLLLRVCNDAQVPTLGMVLRPTPTIKVVVEVLEFMYRSAYRQHTH